MTVSSFLLLSLFGDVEVYSILTELDKNNDYSIYNCNSAKSMVEDTSIKSQ